jgi:hypothetical protein|tara:strand:- start:1264 stop:1560 length:297 start_codon:yes stop_codon:yes gene_type:complete
MGKKPEPAELIKVNGTTETVKPRNGKNFTLNELYKLLNCKMIELVKTHDDRTMVIDEEGKLNEMSWMMTNAHATIMYKYGADDPIVGDALVCDNRQIK